MNSFFGMIAFDIRNIHKPDSQSCSTHAKRQRDFSREDCRGQTFVLTLECSFSWVLRWHPQRSTELKVYLSPLVNHRRTSYLPENRLRRVQTVIEIPDVAIAKLQSSLLEKWVVIRYNQRKYYGAFHVVAYLPTEGTIGGKNLNQLIHNRTEGVQVPVQVCGFFVNFAEIVRWGRDNELDASSGT